MTKLIVQYYSSSLVALQGRLLQQTEQIAWGFEFAGTNNIQVVLNDWIEEANGVRLHLGLLMTITLEAETEETALEIAKGIAESLLNIITLSSLAYCEPAELIGYVDLTNSKIRSLGYPFSNKNPLGSLAILKEDAFREIFEKSQKAPEPNRLMRSISWLRKGINETNSLDEFVSYWIGVEIWRGIFRRQLKMKMKDPPRWEGIKILFDQVGSVDFDKVLDARNDLLHGLKQLDNGFVAEINTYLEPTRTVLIMAIGEILALDQKSISGILSKPLRRQRVRPWLAIEADFQNPLGINEADLVANFPKVDPVIEHMDFKIGDSGDLNISYRVKHHFVGPKDIKWSNMSFEHWGDQDSGITGSGIKLNE